MNGKRKRKKLTLHQRLDLFKAVRPEIADFLIPIRIFGNSGSHEGASAVQHEELLDAFEVVEHALSLLYGSKDKDIAAKAKQLAKKK